METFIAHDKMVVTKTKFESWLKKVDYVDHHFEFLDLMKIIDLEIK